MIKCKIWIFNPPIKLEVPNIKKMTFVFWNFHFDEKNPLPWPKNNFLPIWVMWYQFRHVLMGQMTCASELKPYFHNNEDPWKKNWHFKYWNWPRCNQNSQILAKKSISQCGYLKHSKWAVLWNLSLISIIMRIGEKKLGCHNTKKPQNRICIWKIIAW